MPFVFSFKSVFQKTFDKFPHHKQILVVKALEAIQVYLSSGTAPYGLRIKKLYDSHSGKTFEARVSIDIRIVWVQSQEKVVFALLGNHEDVRRFLRNL